MGKAIDLTNKVFGRLTAIEKTDKRTNCGSIIWKCRCSCDNKIVEVQSSSLVYGSTKSCGCLRIEKLMETTQKAIYYNEYNLNGEFGVGYTRKGEEFYFDLKDYDLIKNHCWAVSKNGYIMTRDIESKKLIYMHKLIFKNEKYKITDHKDRNKKNNRRNNLRNATQIENHRNKDKSKRNTSGFIGISWSEINKKWIAQIRIDGKNIKVGEYINIEDAIVARLKIEKEFFKEFAPQKHLFEEYGIT